MKLSACFVGIVISCQLKVDDQEVPLTNRGGQWTGTCDVEPKAARLPVQLSFLAPGFDESGLNHWSLRIDINGHKVLDDSGAIESAEFLRTTHIEVPSTSDPGK